MVYGILVFWYFSKDSEPLVQSRLVVHRARFILLWQSYLLIQDFWGAYRIFLINASS